MPFLLDGDKYLAIQHCSRGTIQAVKEDGDDDL